MSIDTVHHFWFGDLVNGQVDPAQRKRWFIADTVFDASIKERFAEALHLAGEGGLAHWCETARGALALIILLDQFSRNIYRGDKRAFDFDHQACDVAKRGMDAGFDQQLGLVERPFFYMPLEHSETLADQQACVALFGVLAEGADDQDNDVVLHNLRFAQEHRDIIERFGRFPHRNKMLGRKSSAEELVFLQKDSRSYGQG